MKEKMTNRSPIFWIIIATLAVFGIILVLPEPSEAQGPTGTPSNNDLHIDYVETVPENSHRRQQADFPEITAADPDGDGLTTVDEAALGTDPNDADSDCDFIDDGTEVGNIAIPTDSDADNLIDALESVLVDSNQNNIHDQNDPTSGPQTSCGRFTPFAIQNDNADSARLEARIVGGSNVTSVTATANQATLFPNLDGTPLHKNDIIMLYDDGTHGDQTANDHIWTRGGFTSNASLPSGNRKTFEFNVLTVTDDGGVTQIDRNATMNSSFADIVLGMVSLVDIQTPTVINTEMQHTSNLINVVNPLLSLEVKDADDLTEVSKRIYNTFADEFDFLIYFPESPAPGEPFGRFFNVKNLIQHIGIGQFDNSASYGSDGRLQGAMFVNFGTNGPTLHEVMHNWAVQGLSGLGFSQCVGGHWGPAGVGEGQLGGFDGSTLVDNGNGTYTVDRFGNFANGGDSVTYVPLELYLAGLADANAILPIQVPINADCDSFDFSVFGKTTFKADAMNTVTINDIQAELGGARIPNFVDSQKAFKAGMVVASQFPLGAAEMAFFNEWSKLFGADAGNGSLFSFKEATGNVATMDTTISTPGTTQQAPNVPSNPVPSNGAVNIPIIKNLSWSGGDPDSDIVTYTVAFGTSNPPPIVDMQTTTLFASGILMSNTTYYWRITATDGLSTTAGPTWSFTTTAEATLQQLFLSLLLK